MTESRVDEMQVLVQQLFDTAAELIQGIVAMPKAWHGTCPTELGPAVRTEPGKPSHADGERYLLST